jgi:ubiquinone/menaquinone biosynthesis C-methylase UbiE
MDIDSIQPGEDFVDVLQKTVSSCDLDCDRPALGRGQALKLRKDPMKSGVAASKTATFPEISFCPLDAPPGQARNSLSKSKSVLLIGILRPESSMRSEGKPTSTDILQTQAMDKRDEDEIRDFWNRIADDWNIQVGLEGDSNRILNSDPVLWAFAGNVRGRKVLDAGCGTGYLSKQASDRGALVTGVDFSDRMIEIARANHPSIDFRVDSCTELRTVGDAQFDIVIANYVLMDIPELEATMHAFSRVLRNEGLAVLVFSHPCFPQGRAQVANGKEEVSYKWTFPYFEQRRCVDAPWGTLRRTSFGFIGPYLTTGNRFDRRVSACWSLRSPD